MKAKYLVLADGRFMESNSRNARKHLLEQEAKHVYVFINSEDAPLVSVATKQEDYILVGAVRR